MIHANRPRRSVLYMSGSNSRAMAKARNLPADGLIFDLEDATAPGMKSEARELVMDQLRAGGYGERELFVRVNGLDTEWGYNDLVAVAGSGAHAVLLPKIESAAMVHMAEEILKANGAPDDLAIWCMMETARGLLRAEEIANSSTRLAGFVIGTSDLAKDLRCAHTPQRLPLLTSLSHFLLVARAFDLVILDGVFLDLEDEVGFNASCQQGVELGFDGKTLIHPKQIAAANDAFAPSHEQITFARAVIQTHEQALQQGQGVTVVNGKLIENLHVEDAQRVIAMAEQIERQEGPIQPNGRSA